MLKSKKVLFFLSGSIACYKAMEVLSLLKKARHEVKVVCTPDTFQFIGPSSIEGIIGEAPHVDTFESGNNMSHIDVSRWCDLAVICPATANTINKIAAGIGDNLVTASLLAFDYSKPLLIFPAMNTKMLDNPATQHSLKSLADWGAKIHLGNEGALACGEYGRGRLVEPLDIFEAIEKVDALSVDPPLSSPQEAPLNIVITYGGTKEPIDSVRFISNFSTGRTGLKITEILALRGHKITALHASAAPVYEARNVINRAYNTYADLEKLIDERCSAGPVDLFIQASAVSDYSVKSISDKKANTQTINHKISSEQDSLTIELQKNPKLLGGIKHKCQPTTKVVGFKLTDTPSSELRQNKIQTLFSKDQVDLVVHNDFSEIKSGNHIFSLYQKDEKILSTQSLEELLGAVTAYSPPLIENSSQSRLSSPLEKLTITNPSRFEVER